MHRGSINGIPGGSINPPSGGSLNIQNSRSPVKESYLNRSASIDDQETEQEYQQEDDKDMQSVSPPQKTDGIPIRR